MEHVRKKSDYTIDCIPKYKHTGMTRTTKQLREGQYFCRMQGYTGTFEMQRTWQIKGDKKGCQQSQKGYLPSDISTERIGTACVKEMKTVHR